jgi:pimeloyl-ACP methyl ester carboxylesterase
VSVRVGTALGPDASQLEYRAEGSGPLAMVACNGIGLSTFFWRGLGDYFSRAGDCTFVTWDYPGHGRSPIPEHPRALTIDSCAGDLWAVVDALGCERAVLLGHSMGAQVILEAWRQRPGRVLALVPVLGAAGKVFDNLPLTRLSALVIKLGEANPKLAEKMLRTTLQLPGLWQVMRALRFVHPDLCPREEFEPWFEHFLNLDLRGYFALCRDMLSHDASDLLAQVDVPVLVVGGEHDLFAPIARSREMAAKIPNAELLVVREGSHAALVEQPELIALTLERFLRSHNLC